MDHLGADPRVWVSHQRLKQWGKPCSQIKRAQNPHRLAPQGTVWLGKQRLELGKCKPAQFLQRPECQKAPMDGNFHPGQHFL